MIMVQTALFQALVVAVHYSENQLEFINLLIYNGADVNSTTTINGITSSVLDIAIGFNGKTEIIGLVRNHGGKTSEELKDERK